MEVLDEISLKESHTVGERQDMPVETITLRSASLELP
jgi:hypothetical protein